MKRAYHDLMEQISVPSGLNDRVLQTVRQEVREGILPGFYHIL